jgi:lysophospholipase L1-like esterase
VRFYTALIRKIKKAGAQVVLCTPAAIGEKTDYSNELDGDLNRYSQMIRDLAKQENCGLVDLRKEFLAYNLKHNTQNAESGILTNDRVHLNEKGNAFVAEKMMSALLQP